MLYGEMLLADAIAVDLGIALLEPADETVLSVLRRTSVARNYLFAADVKWVRLI